MKYIVYRIVNTKNGKSYIGISNRPVGERFSEHLTRARQGLRQSRIYAAIRKYGENAFTHEVLARTASDIEVRALETKFIHEFDSYRNGYNCNLGGAGFLEFPAHIKEKIRVAQLGKVVSAECREKMSRAKLGDPRCAKHFGQFTAKGSDNPRSLAYRIVFPDGTENVVTGLRAFCREHAVMLTHLYSRGHSKGYKLLGRLNDYPEREYSQAAGKSGSPATG